MNSQTHKFNNKNIITNTSKIYNIKKGKWIESLACMFLRLKGYHIIETNYRNPCGEIDIIAHKNQYIVFIEVKYRSYAPLLPYALSHKQKHRIIRAASIYLTQHLSKKARFDIIIFNKYLIPHHLQNAWWQE